MLLLFCLPCSSLPLLLVDFSLSFSSVVFFFGMIAPPQEAFLPHPPAGVIKLHLNPDKRVLLLTVNSVPEDKTSVPVVLRAWRFEELASFGCTDRLLVIKIKGNEEGDSDNSQDYYCFHTIAAHEILDHLKQAISDENVIDVNSTDDENNDDSSEEDRGSDPSRNAFKDSSPQGDVQRPLKLTPYRQSLLRALDTDRAVLVQSRTRIARHDSLKVYKSANRCPSREDTHSPATTEDTPSHNSTPDTPPRISIEDGHPETSPCQHETTPKIETKDSPSPDRQKRRFTLTINSPLLRRIFGSGQRSEVNNEQVAGKSSSPVNVKRQESKSSPLIKVKKLFSPKSNRKLLGNSRQSGNNLSVPSTFNLEESDELSDTWESPCNSEFRSPSTSPLPSRKKNSKSLNDLNTIDIKWRTNLPGRHDNTKQDHNPPSEIQVDLCREKEDMDGPPCDQHVDTSQSSLTNHRIDEGSNIERSSSEQVDGTTDIDQGRDGSVSLTSGRVLKIAEESSSDDEDSPLPRERHHSFSEIIQDMFVVSINKSRHSSYEQCRSPLSAHSQTFFSSDTNPTSGDSSHLKDLDEIFLRDRGVSTSTFGSSVSQDPEQSSTDADLPPQKTFRSKSVSAGDIRGRRCVSPESSIFKFQDSLVQMQEVSPTQTNSDPSTDKNKTQMQRLRSKSTTSLFPRTKSFLTRPLPRAPDERDVSMATHFNTVYENDDSSLYQNMRGRSHDSVQVREEENQGLYDNIDVTEATKLSGYYAELDFSDFVSKRNIEDENGRPPSSTNDHPPLVPQEEGHYEYTVVDVAATEALGITLQERQAELRGRSRRKTSVQASVTVGSPLATKKSIPRAWSASGRPFKHQKN